MRRLLLALPFALLPLAALAAEHSHEHDHAHDHAEHGSLDAHEHGAAQLNVVLDGKVLELQLESPAMNLPRATPTKPRLPPHAASWNNRSRCSA